jgi:hypothetical protein
LSLMVSLTIAGAAIFRFLEAGLSANSRSLSVSDVSSVGVDVDGTVASTVAGASTPSSRALVVAGTSGSSTCASIDSSGDSASEVGGCAGVASGRHVGMSVWFSRLSSSSSSLGTVSDTCHVRIKLTVVGPRCSTLLSEVTMTVG